jgi:hypothetical protein
VYPDSVTERRRFELRGITEESLADYLVDEQNTRATLVYKRKNTEGTGFNAAVRYETEKPRLKVEAVDPVRMYYSADAESTDCQDLDFLAERRPMSVSELRKAGIAEKIIERIPRYTETSVDGAERAPGGTVRFEGERADPAAEFREVFECYARVDLDGDGITELHRVLLGGEQILDRAPASYIPYVTGVALIRPHNLTGHSLHDRLKSIQDAKTYLLRQLVDNVTSVNYPRFLVRAGAIPQMSQVTDAAPGGIIEVRDPQAIVPLQVPDMSAGILTAMEYLDRVRSERGGAALDLQAAELQIAGDTAHGVERQYASREKLAGLMIRNIGDTLVKGLYRLVHRTLRNMPLEPIKTRAAGQWQETAPEQWPPREQVVVNLGMTTGERVRRQAALNQIVQIQQMAMQAGMAGQLVDLSNIYSALMDWARCAGVPAPEQYLIDPASQQAQQAAQGQAQQAQQQQAQMAQMQQQMAEMQIQLELTKQERELAHKYWSDTLKAEIEEAKLIGGATKDLEVAQIQGMSRAAQSGE